MIVFRRIPRALWYTAPSCHDFRISLTIETGLFRSQQLMNSHFHFLTVVESSISQVLLQQLKQ